METKSCFKCRQTKSRTEFYGHPAMADGLPGKCKECTKRDSRNRPVALKRAYDRRRAQTPERKLAQRRATRLHRQRYPEKYKARSLVGNAIRDGRLVKQPCRDCGSTTDVHGHHPDYSRPLDVVWLCEPCHRAEHEREASL